MVYMLHQQCVVLNYVGMVNTLDTVQEYLLARVIFGEFVCEKQLVDFILAI